MAKKEHNWKEDELKVSVDAYFALQRRHSAGEKFNMKKALEDVMGRSLPHRNHGAIERRMSNISALLIEMGLPWCQRFKPLRNIGAKVKKVLAGRVMHFVREDADHFIGCMVHDDVPGGQGYAAKGGDSEGARRLISHYVIERSAAAANEAKELNRLNNGGEYCCEVCGDKPGIRYGARVIDAHHIKPISEAKGEYQVRTQDFLIVCPNCHRAIHRLEDYSGQALKAKLSRA